MNTPDEQNDAIRAQVEREIPTPAGGFETDEQTDDHRDAHERRFLELIRQPDYDSLLAQRDALRAALELLTKRAGNVADYDLKGHIRSVWTDKQSISLPGSVANCHALREALTQASAALNSKD